jgi:hypothetical protein
MVVSKANTPPGPGVDASGQSVVDPSDNVRHEMATAMQRQDDLREMESACMRDSQAAEGRHLRELATMRDEHADAMRKSESARLDAIRAVDINAVQRAAEVAATQAATLAGQVSASAEALRIAVEQSATQSRAALTLALEPIQAAIADLRRVQYEAAGQKTQVIETRDTRGESRGNIMVIVAMISMAAVVLGLILAQVLHH